MLRSRMGDFSQNERVIGFIRLHGSITPMQAIRSFRCYRLGARIHELRQMGYPISRVLVKSRGGKHYAKYSLMEG